MQVICSHWGQFLQILHFCGKVIGKTDNKASQVEGNSYDPKDLSWTIMDHFGVKKDLVIVDNSARPRHMFRAEAKNILIDS